jgi:hypothetical protein
LLYKSGYMPSERQLSRIVWCGAVVLGLAIILLGAAQTLAQTADAGPPGKPSAQEKKEPKSADHGTTKLRIVVTGNDKPVSNASVYVKYNEPGGLFHHEKLAEMNFKTNLDGTVKVPEIPRGKILIQVIAKGWHTYGKWYEIETESETIRIKLEPPPRWY